MMVRPTITVREQDAFLKRLREDKEDTSLYVLNTSDLPDRNNRPTVTRGEVLMMVTASDTDATVVIRVPATYVPINLANQGVANKWDILKSADFARALATRRIEVIDSNAALSIIDQDEANRAEYDRAMQRACRITTDEDLTGEYIDDTTVQEINPALELLVNQHNRGQINLPTLKAGVRRMQGTLTDFDMRYLKKEVPLYTA